MIPIAITIQSIEQVYMNASAVLDQKHVLLDYTETTVSHSSEMINTERVDT